MSIDLGFIIQGRGGQALCWLDNAGGVPWSALSNYNFNLLPNAQYEWASTTSGSFLLSDTFAVTNPQKLTIVATVATAHNFPYNDVGFALLLKNSQVHKILFALRPDGATHITDIGPIDINSFAKPSSGVTVTPVVKGVANVVLGGITYGPPTGPSDGTCSADVTVVCTPGAGKYQLLFGAFVVAEPPKIGRPAALIAQFVDVR